MAFSYVLPDPGVGYSGYIGDTTTTNPSFPDFERVRLNSSHVPTTEAPHGAIAVVNGRCVHRRVLPWHSQPTLPSSTVRSAFYHPDSANLTTGIVLGADPVVFFKRKRKTRKARLRVVSPHPRPRHRPPSPAAARYATRARPDLRPRCRRRATHPSPPPPPPPSPSPPPPPPCPPPPPSPIPSPPPSPPTPPTNPPPPSPPPESPPDPPSPPSPPQPPPGMALHELPFCHPTCAPTHSNSTIPIARA